MAMANFGPVILKEDFSTIADGALPDGWIKSHPFSFLWEAEKATGLSGDAIAVKDGKLSLRSNKGAHIVALPPLGTENYVFSVTFQFKGRHGSFGLETDLADDVEKATYATNNMMYPYEAPAGEFAQFARAKGRGDIDRVNTDCANGFFSDKLPDLESDIIFTVYHLEGISFFTCNGRFVSSYKDLERTDTMPRTRVGLYTCGGDISVSTVIVRKLISKTLFERGLTDALTIGEPSLRCEETCFIELPVTMDKTDETLCSLHVLPSRASDSPPLSAVVYPATQKDASPQDDKSTVSGVSHISQDKVSATIQIDIPCSKEADLVRAYTIRPYILYKDKGQDKCLNSLKTVTVSPVKLANRAYLKADADTRARIDAVFAKVPGYQGPNVKRLTFVVFSDFHYKKGMYASRVEDLEPIFNRAADTKAEFIIHAGDFCNDYKGSLELLNAYLNNTHKMPVYGVYGNHELETRDNSMQIVTPALTNRADSITWGTPDGKIGDGSIAHYYFESKGFRIICLDTNYSWNPVKEAWEHNPTGSHCAPKGNTYGNSLGPDQLAWLENVLMDAARKVIPCIVFSHAGFAGKWYSSPDMRKVRDIYTKANALHSGTVLLSVNGHLHTNHAAIIDGILFWDVNTVFNGDWRGGQTEHHYADGMTYDFTDYDADGNPTSTVKRNLSELTQSKNTWFFTDPLSAIVTIDSLGTITIDGAETTWRYGVIPINDGRNGCEPRITSHAYQLDE
ncbi:MAG: metallophosphoesterase [Victivallales bacterium]|nr:metallophosphoesterase [Victivallales bacterium]